MLDAETGLVITGYESDKNPYFNMVERKADGSIERVCPPAVEVLGRQGAPKVYAMNGSVYAWHRHSLKPSLWAAGRIRLHEDYQWTCGDFAHGHSVVEEIAE